MGQKECQEVGCENSHVDARIYIETIYTNTD